jgi:diguanylate cyclase (GGDEF)-like protein/PAS domain S-box-containing protein
LRKLINLKRRNTRSSASSKTYSKGSVRRWASKFVEDKGQEKFTALMEASAQGILIHSYDWKLLFVNNSYANTLGYSLEEANSVEDVTNFYPANEKLRLRGYLQSSLKIFSQLTPPSVYNIEGKHKLGEKTILQHSVSLIDWQGVPSVLISTIDITRQYSAQQALEHSEERFRDFAESATDWCWEMDENLRFTYMSDSFTRLSGWPAKDVIGLTRSEFFEKYTDLKHKTKDEKKRWYKHSKLLLSHKAFSNLSYSFFRPDGSSFAISVTGKPLFNQRGKFCGYRGTSKNITDEKRLSEKLQYQATHDELTGLINRRHFESELNKVLDDVHINNTEYVLLYLDLDRFKIVNDTCGHVAGDRLLQQLASLFKTAFKEDDILARLGGDEFAVILKSCSIESAIEATQCLHKSFDEYKFAWQGRSFSVSVSVGAAKITKNTESVSQLLQNADSACYMAKDTGRNKTHIFSENDADLSRRQGEMHWAVRITEALENDDFTLFAQAIKPLKSSDNIFYELLIRMREGNHLILPNVFLPAAERFDLSLNIDKWVLKKALKWIRDHSHILSSAKLIFINLSAKTIGKKSFLDYAIKVLDEYNVPPEKICFEITETTAIANLAEAVDFIEKLKKIGCEFAIDDFGSGVSSFAYLKNLPVDYLKIDGMFIRDMLSDEVNLALVKSINEVSHVMGKKTIAEFVENDATLAYLANIGIDYAQGYAIGYPFAIDELNNEQKSINFR